MKLKPTILNISILLFIVGILFNTAFNYEQLSKEEGWGIVAMIGLLGVSLVLLIIDFIIQRIFQNKKIANIIGAFVVIITIILFWIK